MKKTGKILGLCILLILTAAPAFSQFDFDKQLHDLENNIKQIHDLQESVSEFSRLFAEALPLNSTIGLNWSDAYIGQLLGIPPRLGIGFSVGTTFINLDAINNLMSMFGESLPVNNLKAGLPLPAYTIEGRIGGIILPFDAGVKVGIIPDNSIPILQEYGIGLDYLLVGGDIRYALLRGKTFPLKLSVGVGLNYMEGKISKNLPVNVPTFEFIDPLENNTYMLTMTNPDLNLRWKTTNLEFKAHASIPLLIFTPYAGIGVSYAWSEAGYEVKSRIMVNDEPINDEIRRILSYYGIHDVTNDGFSSIIRNEGMNYRVFGGLSINVAVLRFDFTAMYNLKDSFGFTFGARFQL
jgi:hypothetical protein